MDIDEYINIQKENLARLREETGQAIMECKKSLVMSGGDYEKAKENLLSPTKNYARLITYVRTK